MVVDNSDADPPSVKSSITRTDYANAIGSNPVLASHGREWTDLTLDRFQVSSADYRLAASSAHRVRLHLAGPVLIERRRDGHRDRRWCEPGTSSVIPAGVPVTRSFKGQADFITVFLNPDVLVETAASAFDRHADQIRLVESFVEADPVLERLCRLLLVEAESGGAASDLFSASLARLMALHILRDYSASSQRPVANVVGLGGWRLRRVVEYMSEHVDQKMPLVQLAKAANLSPSHFARAFRVATGLPPHRYLTNLRIEKARHLLEHTKLPITEISLCCGFENPTHFAMSFRKATGLCPRAYRTVRCYS